MMIRINDDYWCDHSAISAMRRDLIEPGFVSVCFFGGGSVDVRLSTEEISRIANEVNAERAKESR